MNVKFYANFRALVGGKVVEIPLDEGSSVEALLRAVIERYPVLEAKLLDEDGRLHGHVHVFVNGHDAITLPDALQTRLTAQDAVDIFPPVGGGQPDTGVF